MTYKKKNKKPIKLWTFDTETRGLFGGVFRCGLYDGKSYYAGNDFSCFLPVIGSQDLFDNHIYVHNLDFDISKIFPEILETGGIVFDESLFINGRAVSIKTSFGFTFHDSFSLLPSSLEKLSKDFGLTKTAKYDLSEYMIEKGYAVYTDGEFNKKESLGNFFENVPANDKILNEYLKLDCISLYDIITILAEISELGIEKIVKCPTAASLSMAVFRTNYNEEYKKATSYQWKDEKAEYIEKLIRSGYCGGRTEVFRPFLSNGYHYDVNSLYPYCMRKYNFPVGFPKIYCGQEAFFNYEYCKKSGSGAGFLHCTVEVPEMFIPPLPKKAATGKLIFPVGKFSGVWSYPELIFAESKGVKICEVEEGVYFKETAGIFEGFVNQFEKIKINSTGAKRAFSKLVQNSLYGKFGMRRDRSTYTDYYNLQKLKDENKEFFIKVSENFPGLKFIEYTTTAESRYIQPQIAAYVTSYARLELLKGLYQQEENGQVFYCDTDSIAGNAPMPDDMIHDKTYGKWKLENHVEEGIFLQPKFYMEEGEETTIRAKGVPREIMERFTKENYKLWASEIAKGEKTRIDLYDNLPARRKFLTCLKHDKDFDTPDYLRKSIHILAGQKRVLDFENNTSRPLYADEFVLQQMPERLKMIYDELVIEATEPEDEI